MNNKNIKVTVSKQKNSITVNAEIPKMNPRKNINYIRYDVTNARNDALAEYGPLVGNLRSNEPEDNPVLDNKNRPSGNILNGTWVFNTTDTTSPTFLENTFKSMETAPTRAKTRKTTRRRTKTTTE